MLLALVMLAGAVPAALAAEAPANYYGSRLTDQAAIAFYQAMKTMDFASGENLEVEAPAVKNLAAAYAGMGDDGLIRSFGAAVDSFRYDHTELFYVDWDMFSVNVGRKSGRFVVNIGTGRTDSYLLNKEADIAAQKSSYDAALEQMAAGVKKALPENATVKDKAKAANDAVCAKVTYDFCDDGHGNATDDSRYIRTAYGALVNGKAVCEGYSRLYKAVMNKLGVECELVSGYFLDGERFEPHMWNYVKDEEGHWYAVDVTMNDGHTLQSGGPVTTFNKYFWQTEELFAIDHIEDGKVSSAEYEMPYPKLHKFWKTPTESGRFASGTENYEGTAAFWFNFDGKSAETLKKEGLYMAFRTATTNAGEMEWTPWQSVDEYNHKIPGIAPSKGDKTYFLGTNRAMIFLEVGIFDIPEDNQYSALSVAYSDEAVRTHLIETLSAENPDHNPDYIAPAFIKKTKPEHLLQTRQNVTGTQHVELEYNMPLRVVGGKQFELTWDVSSYNNRDLSLETVQKNAKLQNVKFDGDRTISFDFTPSRAYNHNMIFYDFTPKNIVNVLNNGKDGVALGGFSLMYEYKDSIACCKIFNDGRLYVNSYAQPSIAMNGDLSTTGWRYIDEDGAEKRVSESQRSQMALVVTRPGDSEKLTGAVAGKLGGGDAVAQSVTYEIDLNICGKIAAIPNGSYVKLNLGIPDGFAGLAGREDIKFKLYHFKRDANGELDYNKPEEIACVLTPYGIIAEVNSFSPYVLAAVDNSKLPEAERDTSKGIALVCNGHGGRVNGPAVATLAEGGSTRYTLAPDTGYAVEFVRLNGRDVTPDGNSVTLTYAQLARSNTLEVGFVAQSVKDAERDAGIEHVNPVPACAVTFDSNGGSAVAAAHVAIGSTAAKPAEPTKSGYRFDGWYVDHALTSAYDFSAPVVANITLFAKWTKRDGGGSVGSGGSGGSGGTPAATPTVPAKPEVSGNTPAWENRFADVKDSDWFYSAVKFAVENGLFHGTGANEFTPEGNMTRGMLATVLYRLAKEPEAAAGQSFGDVAGGQYYAAAVRWAAGKNIVNGYNNGNFGPNDFVTREALAVMLWRYAGRPAGAGSLNRFTDRDTVSAWAVDALQWAVEQGLVGGKSNGVLDPGGNATRAEVATILMRYCKTEE